MPKHLRLYFCHYLEEDGHFAPEGIEMIKKQIHQFDCLAIGPGMSRYPGGEQWMKDFISVLGDTPLVIDADALFMLREQLELVRNYQGDVIFTPHPGEMATLVNKTVKEVEESRLDIAQTFAKEHGVYLLLKGHRTVIASPAGDVFINPHGNDALGKGGSGDVLTGMIASFIAQGSTPIQALISASYLHARAGEEKGKLLSNYGVLPFDIIDGIGEQLSNMD
ncbi:NAD(P)H-hydrate dehydratase [Bacillus sp. T3]|uniref:NAD(P)H-hydrate dehydratase n=1 Tax=Bacillus sp. T3 TaxID=467262 RepID=UPI003993B98B